MASSFLSFDFFRRILGNIMQSPDDCFNISIKNMERVGKLKPVFLKIILLAYDTINYHPIVHLNLEKIIDC